MTLNETKFVETIKDHPMNYEKKLGNALRLNVVAQVSRTMLLELAEIYMLINPQYNIKMLNVSCASCVLTLMKDIANNYFRLLPEYEEAEVIAVEELIEASNNIIVTEEIMTQDLQGITENPVIIEPKKKGRPAKVK